MNEHCDLLIVGAGPAGMSAAIAAREHGLSVVLVDEQAAPGGQIWRGLEARLGAADADPAGEDRTGLDLIRRFRECGAQYLPRTEVWHVEPDPSVFLRRDGKLSQWTARTLLLATGAQERPSPFPGWTLPGVMTVGAGQILLKTSGLVPKAPVWICGNGPLPLLYMQQLLRAGGRVAGFLDTGAPWFRLGALSLLPQALWSPGDLARGIGWIAALRRAGVRHVRGVTGIEALGDDHLRALRYRTADGASTEIAADLLLCHEGVVPQIHMTFSLGCRHRWSPRQHCFIPDIGEWGESSVPNVFIAGDGAGIGGARAAALRGTLAGLGIAHRLGRLSLDDAARRAAGIRRRLSRQLALRPFIDMVYRPRDEIKAPAGDTVVCRCEEVSAARIGAIAAETRTPDPNRIKALTRAGMGPCQGRQCGYTVSSMLAASRKDPEGAVGFFRVRPPIKPITLGELAGFQPGNILP